MCRRLKIQMMTEKMTVLLVTQTLPCASWREIFQCCVVLRRGLFRFVCFSARLPHSLEEIGRYFFLSRVGLFVCFLSFYVVKDLGSFVHFKYHLSLIRSHRQREWKKFSKLRKGRLVHDQNRQKNCRRWRHTLHSGSKILKNCQK